MSVLSPDFIEFDLSVDTYGVLKTSVLQEEGLCQAEIIWTVRVVGIHVNCYHTENNLDSTRCGIPDTFSI